MKLGGMTYQEWILRPWLPGRTADEQGTTAARGTPPHIGKPGNTGELPPATTGVPGVGV